MNDCHQVSEYLRDITLNMRVDEMKDLPSPDYMNHQKDIEFRMRGILVDWIVMIHLKIKLNPDTLFLTVNIIDRYLSKKQISRKEL